MFNALYRSIVMVFRMLKNALLRPFRSLYARARSAASLTRQASKVVPKVVKTVTTVKVKPKSRADYIDAGPVYVAKSLIFVVIGVLVALFLAGRFFVWPWMESRWFTARIYALDDRAETHTGRVELYYDEALSEIAFSGRLREGVKTGRGTEYYENGVAAFEGSFDENGLYSGHGIRRGEDGSVVYEGGFAAGLYEGEGQLYEDGQLLYEGEFSAGAYQGEGRLYAGGLLAYEGDFVSGAQSGQGKAYEDGALAYEGGFQDGLYSGAGKTYYPDGTVRAECATFSAGQIDGACVLYYESGAKKFEGTFSQGQASGQGTLYDESGARTYYGGFEQGLKSGTGTEYYADGKKEYEGGFAQGQREGEGTLYRADGTVLYSGGFSQGLYEGTGTLHREDGARVEGAFVQGEILGAASFYDAAGALLYAGGFADGSAQGAGTLYVGGAAVFTGNFASGFPDGASVLDLPVGDLRETVFAGAELSESRAEQGFVIDNPGADMAVFCNYGYNDAEIVVHRLYLYGESLLSRFSGAAFVPPEGYTDVREGRETPLLLPGVAATAQVPHDVTRYDYGAYTLRLWRDEAGNIDLIEWRSYTDLAIEGGAAETPADAEESLIDGLLSDLGLTAPADGTAANGTDADGTAANGETTGGGTADGTAADGTEENGTEESDGQAAEEPAGPTPAPVYDGLSGGGRS